MITLIVDPAEEDDNSVEVRKLSQWDPEEEAIFADAKRLTYIGDRATASDLLRERVEPWHEFPFEELQLIPRESPFGKFLCSQWQAQMPRWPLAANVPGAKRSHEEVMEGRERTLERQEAVAQRCRLRQALRKWHRQ